ncbi:hypothetical protein [Cutibacterium sp. V970]|uniref:hypothetical protein n=1 Tax=Cutibacterium sp. V970 TaxID=3446481 RepID=UPI003EE308C6
MRTHERHDDATDGREERTFHSRGVMVWHCVSGRWLDHRHFRRARRPTTGLHEAGFHLLNLLATIAFIVTDSLVAVILVVAVMSRHHMKHFDRDPTEHDRIIEK